MAKALELWTRAAIEEAPRRRGGDCSASCGAVGRALGSIPRYQLAMLEYFAEQQRTTVSDVLTRELEGVASEHAQELSKVVPGFGAAPASPDADNPQLPC